MPTQIPDDGTKGNWEAEAEREVEGNEHRELKGQRREMQGQGAG
jgi:hypothetical protein